MERKDCYINCDVCKKTTKHEQIKAGKTILREGPKIIAYVIKFKCSECGNIVTFRKSP